jgi:hypothetical protein
MSKSKYKAGAELNAPGKKKQAMPLEAGMALLQGLKTKGEERREKRDKAIKDYIPMLIELNEKKISHTKLIDSIYQITGFRMTYDELKEVVGPSNSSEEVSA